MALKGSLDLSGHICGMELQSPCHKWVPLFLFPGEE